MASVKDLLGKIMVSVEADEDTLAFTTDDGRVYHLYHDQECCESVTIESIVGDLADLVGAPLLMAEEITGESPDGWEVDKYTDSYTWTFYKFATRKGYVDVRWFGESNGYYSESVDFAEVRRK